MKLKDIEIKIVKGTELTSEEEDYLLKKISDYRDEHPDVTHRFPRWKKILAWVSGYQYMDVHKSKNVLMPVKLERKRKLVFNRLKPFIRTMVGKLLAIAPQMGVVPRTDESEDIDAARFGDLVVESLSDKLGFEKLRRFAYLWLVLLNRVYIRVFWNELDHGILGYEQPVGLSQEINLEDLKSETPIEPEDQKFEAITEPGDVTMEVVPPFNCRPDPLYFDPKKWRWFIYCERADAEALEDEYDLESGSIIEGSEKEGSLDDAWSLSATGDKDFNLGVPAEKEDVVGRTAIKTEFWTPRIYAFVAGKKLLEYGINPYNQIPFFTYEEQIVPVDNYEKGIVYNDSRVKDIIPPQREYNRWISLMSLALERATKIKIMSGFDSLVNKKQFYDDGGIVIIDYNTAMGKPEQFHLDPLPGFAMQYKQELEREMESGSNVHEVSMGRLPERASHASGTLVNLLVEQDDQVLDPVIRDMDAVFSEAWSLVLRIVHDNYVRPRMLKIAGRDNIDSVINFEGADLKGNTDVQVTTQVGLPKSRALRIQWIMKLGELGLVKDPKELLEMIEFGQAKKVYADQLLHERKATRENLFIERNKNIDINQIAGWRYKLDADDIHLKIHLRDRLSPKYDHYEEPQKNALNAHIEAHLVESKLMQQPVNQAVGQNTLPNTQGSIPQEATGVASTSMG